MGRDQRKAKNIELYTRFNPRARMGRDESRLCARNLPSVVSIHAPAWGATKGKP